MLFHQGAMSSVCFQIRGTDLRFYKLALLFDFRWIVGDWDG